MLLDLSSESFQALANMRVDMFLLSFSYCLSVLVVSVLYLSLLDFLRSPLSCPFLLLKTPAQPKL